MMVPIRDFNFLESFLGVKEKSRMIMTIQPRKIINAYLRWSTKTVEDNISLRLLNFSLKIDQI